MKKKARDILKIKAQSQTLVTHACNPSYSGGRSGESQFKASPGKEFTKSSLEKTQHKKKS
jgi:hypothetical protein